MYLKLPSSYLDPDTQAPLPDAVLFVADAQFSLRTGSSILQLTVYANLAAAVAGRKPVSEKSTALDPDEIAAQEPALLAACYAVLQHRPMFATSTIVP